MEWDDLLESGPSGFVKRTIPFSRVLRKPDFESNNKLIFNATTDTRILHNAAATTKATSTAAVEIPVTCYQLVGVPDKAEKDEIVRSVMQLKNAEVEEGYTMDAVISRQDLLMDVRDKLLFEPEYAGNPTSRGWRREVGSGYWPSSPPASRCQAICS
ncbi:PLASTID DIVISION PROTEIN CDP1 CHLOROPLASTIC-RELATED [Salix koriyanagi]|uniref:PLASTID DIVISION PROTEIN CDP1 CHLOROPLASTIC-RELATED n=1 Tax=Salix koriyanagi TaxID=2511006 RepID=A0A9Q0SSC2_9ROSI|nr:PLASTID DIVISION PROTEIN CDP1 CHLOROPLASTIC-RELATED [Salix koriyanagi]